MKGESASIVTNSTGCPTSSSRRSASAMKWSKLFWSGANSTRRSTSLSGRASPRATEPKRARRRTPSWRISASAARRRSIVSVRFGAEILMPALYLAGRCEPRGIPATSGCVERETFARGGMRQQRIEPFYRGARARGAPGKGTQQHVASVGEGRARSGDRADPASTRSPARTVAHYRLGRIGGDGRAVGASRARRRHTLSSVRPGSGRTDGRLPHPSGFSRLPLRHGRAAAYLLPPPPTGPHGPWCRALCFVYNLVYARVDADAEVP